MNQPKKSVLIDERITSRYPARLVLADGTELTLTPMVPSDWELVKQFLTAIPEDERQFLRHDVSDPEIVERWCAELDYRHILPLLAWSGDRIVADATLEREPGLWTAHLARLRLLVHPEFRGRGIGTELTRHLIELARDLMAHMVIAECAAEQSKLIAFLKQLDFQQAAILPEFIRDQQGHLHDMVLMVHRL